MAIRAASRADAAKDADHPKLSSEQREKRVAGPLTLISLAIAALWSGSTKDEAAPANPHHSGHPHDPKGAALHDKAVPAHAKMQMSSTPENTAQDHSRAAPHDLAEKTAKAPAQDATPTTLQSHRTAGDQVTDQANLLHEASGLASAPPGHNSADGISLPSGRKHAPDIVAKETPDHPVETAKHYVLADLLSDLDKITLGQTEDVRHRVHDVAINDFLSATALDALQRGQDPMAALAGLGPEFKPEIAALSAQSQSPLYAILHSANDAAHFSFSAADSQQTAAFNDSLPEINHHDLPHGLNFPGFM